ncbi:hypothetical protein AB0478_09950 [Streptomyces sp. NPDC051917]|uniref:hypothetical protein n=1 Tax=Streptomyces sp. NPDC051917 TaxID=3154754 RepID=UPI00344B341E
MRTSVSTMSGRRATAKGGRLLAAASGRPAARGDCSWTCVPVHGVTTVYDRIGDA